MLVAIPTLSPMTTPRPLRHRPKLSLQISALPLPSQTPVSARPNSAMSPMSRNTFMNRHVGAAPVSPVSSASSSSSAEDSPRSPNLKDKKRRRRYVREKSKKAMSAHHPNTPAASFMMPSRQPAQRGRALARGKRVGFVEEITIHYISELEDDDAADQEPEQTAMEKAREIERLKKWVQDNSPNGNDDESKEWVRKLVALEMGEMDLDEPMSAV